MATLTVTTKGQVTFKKEVLQHMHVAPGEKIQIDILPDGKISLKAKQPTHKINGFLGLLAGKSGKTATLKEIEETAASGWAGK